MLEAETRVTNVGCAETFQPIRRVFLDAVVPDAAGCNFKSRVGAEFSNLDRSSFCRRGGDCIDHCCIEFAFLRLKQAAGKILNKHSDAFDRHILDVYGLHQRIHEKNPDDGDHI